MDDSIIITSQTPPSDKPFNPKNVRNATIALIALFVVVIFTITILNPLLNHSAIAPTNPEISSNLSSTDLANLESSVKEQLKSSYQLSNDDLDNLNIVIREDTFTTEQKTDNTITVATFLIDLNSPELTYQVKYNPASKSAILTCPSIDLVQNPNIFCIGTNDQSTIDANLAKYLPYEGTTANDDDFSISHQGGDSYYSPYLNIYASVCNDETIATEVETAVKEWIRDKGIPNPDIIPLHFPHSYCNDRE